MKRKRARARNDYLLRLCGRTKTRPDSRLIPRPNGVAFLARLSSAARVRRIELKPSLFRITTTQTLAFRILGWNFVNIAEHILQKDVRDFSAIADCLEVPE